MTPHLVVIRPSVRSFVRHRRNLTFLNHTRVEQQLADEVAAHVLAERHATEAVARGDALGIELAAVRQALTEAGAGAEAERRAHDAHLSHQRDVLTATTMAATMAWDKAAAETEQSPLILAVFLLRHATFCTIIDFFVIFLLLVQ